jgi:hypothetical protein
MEYLFEMHTMKRFEDPTLIAILQKMREQMGAKLSDGEWHALLDTELDAAQLERKPEAFENKPAGWFESSTCGPELPWRLTRAPPSLHGGASKCWFIARRSTFHHRSSTESATWKSTTACWSRRVWLTPAACQDWFCFISTCVCA